MNILCSFALKQIKRKRSRTVITSAAIVLSAALLTAVVNFAASGNAMLQGFLGADYGLYGGAYTMMLLVPAAVLAALIIAMSVIVISNAFRMSAGERIAQFGTLKCVGATADQIYRTVMYECLLLCAISIPVGIALGYFFSFLGIGVVNLFMEDFNVLVRAMMKRIDLELSFVFSPLALLVSAVISLGTVLFAAMLPARKAMRISALDCLRNGGETDLSGYRRTKITVDAGGAIEYRLARKNVSSNRGRMHSAVTAFALSIMLFVTMSGLKEIADGIQDYIYTDYGYTVIADYTAVFENRIHPETGRREQMCAHPIDAGTAEEITGKLREYEGTEIYGDGQDYSTYVAVLAPQDLTEEMRKALYGAEEEAQPKIFLDVERIILDDRHYQELCAQAGVGEGAVILLNDYSYNDRGTERHIAPLSAASSVLNVEKADGSREQIRIDAVLSGAEIPRQLLYANTNPVRLVVPSEGMSLRGYNWMAAPTDEDGFIAYAEEVLADYFPQYGMDYEEAGYTTRAYGAQDFSKLMNIAIILAAFFLYAFVLLLGLIGVLNVISTLSFQIRLRAREFAVLQSVGMPSESLQKMLTIESVLCAGKALVVGLPVGMGIVWLLAHFVKRLFPIPFAMPWAAIAAAVAAAFLVMWGTVRVSAGALKKQNIIETIRN
ncbi:MAG: ABC transporter permease [Bacteroidales bacterium]|nr:ABC transporter permease [Bacteroidales bacterium]MCM1416112.1 ABC transporter permease [bacterium]MCM1422844.1 ABC transporter permease [bacterium]